MQRIRDIALYALYKFTTYLLTYTYSLYMHWTIEMSRRSVRSSSPSMERCGDTEPDKSQCDHPLHDGISVS